MNLNHKLRRSVGAISVAAVALTGCGASTTSGVSAAAAPVQAAAFTASGGAPDVCLKALDAAEDIIGTAGEFAELTTDLVDIMREALSGGGNLMSVPNISDRIQTITARMQPLAGKVTESGYAGLAAQCRAAK